MQETSLPTQLHYIHSHKDESITLPIIVDASEAWDDVAEAAVSVELRLALCPFDGAFKATAEKALGDEKGWHIRQNTVTVPSQFNFY